MRRFKRRYRVSVDPATQILPVIGTKEGLGHFPMAFVNPRDVVLIPDPAYPVYHSATVLAGGISKRLPLREENDFLPDLDHIDRSTRSRAKVLFLNYPNNPTAAVADRTFYRRAVDFALKNEVILVNDAAYAEITYGGFVCPSLLQERGAPRVAVEFHSFSKTYNMCGWRVGFAVGNADLIAGLAKLKSNLDSDVFGAILGAAATALKGGGSHLKRMLAVYRERRDILVGGLRDLGWEVRSPRATFYLWVRVPGRRKAVRRLKRAGFRGAEVGTHGSCGG